MHLYGPRHACNNTDTITQQSFHSLFSFFTALYIMHGYLTCTNSKSPNTCIYNTHVFCDLSLLAFFRSAINIHVSVSAFDVVRARGTYRCQNAHGVFRSVWLIIQNAGHSAVAANSPEAISTGKDQGGNGPVGTNLYLHSSGYRC